VTAEAFVCQCIQDTLDGIRDGLSHFSGPSRVAVIYAINPSDPIRIFDPQNLLQGHEPKFKELFLDNERWRECDALGLERKNFGDVSPLKNLDLAGLISFGGRSSSVFYQMWFTDHHPDMCSISPTELWLEHTTWRFSHDIANKQELYTGISGSFLKEYATHAVRDHIVDEFNVLLGWDTQIRVYPVLDAVLGISRTREEGAWPRGALAFIEPFALPQVNFLTQFPISERPTLENFKHVCKLLQAVGISNRMLVSNGKSIVGIASGEIPAFSVVADFKGGHGFLRMRDRQICSFSDGHFKSTTRLSRLVQVEEALLESDLDPETSNMLFKIVTSLVHKAQNHKHGCTLVIDLNKEPTEISGQQLLQPLDLKDAAYLELAQSLSKVDGALHLGRDLQLHGFACLLDGRAIAGEDRSRGARFNSALRFCAEHQNILVVVVSMDRPASIIQDGVEISAQCQWSPLSSCFVLPPTIEEWINWDE
jgi:hypothetical protein